MPFRLKTARLTDLSPGSTIDNAVAEVEANAAGLLGATLDQDYPSAIVSPITHDHGAAGGVQVDHTRLANIGTNTHAQLDTFVASKAAASGLCDLDGSSLVPLARIPATLTGKDADTLDTLHAASFEHVANKGAASGYAALDGASRIEADHAPLAASEQLTAGEAVVLGDVCYLKSDGKLWKANANAEATSGPVRLFMAGGTIAGGAVGTFYHRCYATTGAWTTGAAIYLSAATAGAMTATAPATATQIVRVLGYANSATAVYFEPSAAWVVRT